MQSFKIANKHLAECLQSLGLWLHNHQHCWQPSFGRQSAFVIPDDCHDFFSSAPVCPTAINYDQRPYSIPPHFKQGIKGRKLEQIASFAAHVESSDRVYDYCCGKAHLSRMIGSSSPLTTIRGIDIDKALVNAANTLIDKQGLTGEIRAANAMTENIQFKPDEHILSLHSCGILHTKLIEKIKFQRPAAASISPCCYHKRQGLDFEALSSVGKSSVLKLSQSDLKLAVRGTKTARLGEQEQFHTLRTRRLMFDSICRTELNHLSYTPLPSLPMARSQQPIRAFLEDMFRLKGLPEPSLSDEQIRKYWMQAQERYQKEIDKERFINRFQPYIELWIVMDLALALQESNYDVEICYFVDAHATPRNFLIQGRRI